MEFKTEKESPKGCLLGILFFSLFIAAGFFVNYLLDAPGDTSPSPLDEENAAMEQAQQEELEKAEFYENVEDWEREESQKAEEEGIIPWSHADEYIGEYMTVRGIVEDVDQPGADGDPIFVDVGAKYPNKQRVTGVIWSEYHSVFPNIKELVGKEIYMEGTLYEREGVVNIELTDEYQIKETDGN